MAYSIDKLVSLLSKVKVLTVLKQCAVKASTDVERALRGALLNWSAYLGSR
jgi:hypothetical protein